MISQDFWSRSKFNTSIQFTIWKTIQL